MRVGKIFEYLKKSEGLIFRFFVWGDVVGVMIGLALKTELF